MHTGGPSLDSSSLGWKDEELNALYGILGTLVCEIDSHFTKSTLFQANIKQPLYPLIAVDSNLEFEDQAEVIT